MPTVAEVMAAQDQVAPNALPPARRPLVIVVGADKGGVGKTVVARTFDDYLQRRRATRKVFDGQYPGGDLRRFVASASIVNMNSVDDQMRTFDSVEGVTLVDLPAMGLSPTLKRLAQVGILDDVREGQLNLAVLHVLGQSVASMGELGATISALGPGSHYYPVKNLQTEFGFQEWDTDPKYAEALKTAEPLTITIPHLEDRASVEVQRAGVSFDTFALNAMDEAGQPRSRMLRGYVRDWLRLVCAEYDRVGLGKLVKAATEVSNG